MWKKIVMAWICGAVIEFVWKGHGIASNCVEVFWIPASSFKVSCVLHAFCFCLSASLTPTVTCRVPGLKDH
jgi:hypothetical protein